MPAGGEGEDTNDISLPPPPPTLAPLLIEVSDDGAAGGDTDVVPPCSWYSLRVRLGSRWYWLVLPSDEGVEASWYGAKILETGEEGEAAPPSGERSGRP